MKGKKLWGHPVKVALHLNDVVQMMMVSYRLAGHSERWITNQDRG